ncbi:MAG: cytochrome c peroxidase [Aliarcobacter sp.]|jgi:cytochrome c peroxidase|nr:cytochrome c peroxidase [Aliarcobacter sp.]
MKSLYLLFIPFVLLAENLISPVPININLNEKKVLLGKKLFFDTRLSKDNTISCASCHDISNGGDDNRAFSIGVNNQIGIINASTVLNSSLNFVQFWDGRAANLAEQALGPIHQPIEMNTNFPEIISKLKNDKDYIENFNLVYNDKINENNIIDAIVEFEKSLITPNSKFDKYLNNKKNILNEREQKGYELFRSYGCISCHNGVNIGGNLFQKVGVINRYFKDEEKNYGRYNITGKEEDKFYFKVPTLRNIELTSPYLHDGSINDLKSTIEVMLKYQSGIIYNKEDIENLEIFLKTLNGEIPKL